MTRLRKKTLIFLLVVGLGGLWLVFAPGCPLRNLTGIPCPGCGMSRAWAAFLRGNWCQALAFHPMFWMLPVVAWLGWREFRPFPRNWANAALILTLLGLLLGCYAVRMYFGWII